MKNTFKVSTWKTEVGGSLRIKASLVYTVNSRPVRTVSKRKQSGEEKKRGTGPEM